MAFPSRKPSLPASNWASELSKACKDGSSASGSLFTAPGAPASLPANSIFGDPQITTQNLKVPQEYSIDSQHLKTISKKFAPPNGGISFLDSLLYRGLCRTDAYPLLSCFPDRRSPIDEGAARSAVDEGGVTKALDEVGPGTDPFLSVFICVHLWLVP